MTATPRNMRYGSMLAVAWISPGSVVSLIDSALGKGEVQPNRQAATLASRVIFDLNQSLSAEKVTGFAMLASRSPTRVQVACACGEYRAGRAGPHGAARL